MPCICKVPVPLIRRSLLPGIPADRALEIVVKCPGCGAFQQIGGYTGISDAELRPGLYLPPPDTRKLWQKARDQVVFWLMRLGKDRPKSIWDDDWEKPNAP
jgi:hypothetical protein